MLNILNKHEVHLHFQVKRNTYTTANLWEATQKMFCNGWLYRVQTGHRKSFFFLIQDFFPPRTYSFNNLFQRNSTKDLTLNNKDTNFKILFFKHLLNTTPFFLLHSKVVSFKLAEPLGLSTAMKSKVILHVKLKQKTSCNI